jgi:hypothetical protein
MVDLTGLAIGDAVRVSDLKLPAKVTVAMDGDLVVASVTITKAGVEDAETEAGEATEGGEE